MTDPGHNPKVAPDGSWAPFRGWSILFDQVDGISLEGGASMTGDTISSEQGPLSVRLAAMLTEAQPPVAVLPPSTHHVTICDGVNPGVVARSGTGTRVDLVDGPMPDVLHGPIQDVIDAAADGLDFEVGRVELRNHALVLSLEPTPADRARAAELERRRDRLLTSLGGMLGLDLVSRWRPHITLAYRHPRTGTLDVQAVDRLLDVLRVEQAVVTATGAGFYRFDSMVSFRRDVAWAGPA